MYGRWIVSIPGQLSDEARAALADAGIGEPAVGVTSADEAAETKVAVRAATREDAIRTVVEELVGHHAVDDLRADRSVAPVRISLLAPSCTDTSC